MRALTFNRARVFLTTSCRIRPAAIVVGPARNHAADPR